jgi:hypothetical protein
LTQDQFGGKYEISGPAIFKFEKGYMTPSLDLWMKIAKDAGISEQRAVLLWLKSKLPREYREYIELQSASVAETKAAQARKRARKMDYSKLASREQILDSAAEDEALPSGLRNLLEDDELWALYKPAGREINRLRDIFGPLGEGDKDAYRDALRLIREFRS